MNEEIFKQALLDRVSAYALRYHSRNELGKKIGMSSATMSGYFNSMQGYGVPMAIVRNCPEVSLEWLFRGDGAMLLVKDPKPEPARELPHPGTDPALVKVLLDRIEAQAVTIARLTEENTRYKSALGIV